MAQVLIEEKYLEDIADALRKKTGTNDTYTPAQMAETIRSLGIWSWVKNDGSHYFHLVIEEKWQLTTQLNLLLKGTIDWGDGTTTACDHSTVTLVTHTYSEFGKYIIHVTSQEGTNITWGSNNFNYNSRTRKSVRYLEFGRNWTAQDNAFNSLERAKYVFIHQFDTNSFDPYGGTPCTMPGTMFYNWWSLEYIKCNTGIVFGVGNGSGILQMRMLKKIISPCVQLRGAPATGSSNSPLRRLQNLGRGIYNNSSGVNNNYQSWLSGTENLREFVRIEGGETRFFPQTVPTLPVCDKLVVAPSIATIPYSITGAKEVHILRSTPPTLSGQITGLNSNCRIFVPESSLSTYASATNWSNYVEYMLGE